MRIVFVKLFKLKSRRIVKNLHVFANRLFFVAFKLKSGFCQEKKTLVSHKKDYFCLCWNNFFKCFGYLLIKIANKNLIINKYFDASNDLEIKKNFMIIVIAQKKQIQDALTQNIKKKSIIIDLIFLVLS